MRLREDTILDSATHCWPGFVNFAQSHVMIPCYDTYVMIPIICYDPTNRFRDGVCHEHLHAGIEIKQICMHKLGFSKSACRG